MQYLFASDLLLVGSCYVDLRRRRSSLRSVPGFSFYCLCCGIRRFLAASVSVRRFSRSTSEAAVLMSLTTAFRSLVFTHIPASLGSLELLVVMCVTIVCRFGVHIREYGSCDPFYSVRRLVYVDSGHNKCSVWFKRVCLAVAVAVYSCVQVLLKPSASCSRESHHL